MTKMLRVSIESFARELAGDLARLIKEHPQGVYFSALQEEYGESVLRIQKAASILEEKGLLTIHQAVSKAHYVLPKDYVAPEPLVELTALQRRLALRLVEIVREHGATNLVRTSYSQLSRMMECSYGGCLTSVNRLIALNYVEVVQQSQAGHQNQLILKVTTTLLERVDNHLTS